MDGRVLLRGGRPTPLCDRCGRSRQRSNQEIRRLRLAVPAMNARTAAALDLNRFESLRAEWRAFAVLPPPNGERFRAVKHEADVLIHAGLWTSGPSDMLTVLGRHRDELMHTRLISWLLV